MPSPDCTVAKQGVYEGYDEACKAYGFVVSSPAGVGLTTNLKFAPPPCAACAQTHIWHALVENIPEEQLAPARIEAAEPISL